MADLKDVVAYLCVKYPHKQELSKARLTKMVYLADWLASINFRRQLTNISWVFNHFGPYVEDVVELARSDLDFDVCVDKTYHGSIKEVIAFNGDPGTVVLSEEERSVLEYVVKATKDKYWDEFIRLVYSTYPILTEPRFSTLDLVALAEEYRATRGE